MKPRIIPVESIVEFLSICGVKERSLAILGCHMDESSDKGGKKVFAVGAVIGNDIKWQWLQDEWKAVLKPEGIAYFRSKKEKARTSVTNCWNESRTAELQELESQ